MSFIEFRVLQLLLMMLWPRFTCLLFSRTADGNRTIKRRDCTTAFHLGNCNGQAEGG